ncbi:MAG: TetR/AcrR family transcriptional regulator [Actinomycetota bacterium]
MTSDVTERSQPGHAESTRGRPRDDDRTEAIVDAAIEVMYDLGWDGFKVQEVARRAGAGLATIYRRWATKEDLVAAAMRRDIDLGIFADLDGDARQQLEHVLDHLGDKIGRDGGSVISVLAAARHHAAMREALDDMMHDTVRTLIRDLIGEMIGGAHPQVVTLTDCILGAVIFRAGLLEVDTTGAEFSSEMLALVDAVGSPSS